MKDIESVLPKYNCALYITHNQHKSYYESVEDAVAEIDEREPDSWATPEERQRALDSDSIWRVQWYPDTPIGFYVVHASSLSAALQEGEKG